MSWATTYWIALGAVIAGGIVPAVFFLVTWRPRARFSARQLDAGGWVGVVLALYLLAAFRALAGHYRLPTSAPEAVVALAIGAGIDALLWVRLVRWSRFRREPDHPLRRCTDPQPPDGS